MKVFQTISNVRCEMNPTRKFSLTAIAVGFSTALLASCGGSDDDTVTPVAEAAPVTVPFTNGVATTSNAVAYWNKIATDTINVAPAATGTAEEQRPAFAVDLATVHVAIYDAVNAIVGTHKTFGATPATPAAGASQEAAAAAAAHGVLKVCSPIVRRSIRLRTMTSSPRSRQVTLKRAASQWEAKSRLPLWRYAPTMVARPRSATRPVPRRATFAVSIRSALTVRS